MAKEVRTIRARLEPVENQVNTKDLSEIYSQNPILLRWLGVLIDSPFFDGIYCALIEAAEDAMNNKDGRWNEYDRENKGIPIEKMPYFSYQLPKIGM